MVAFIDRFDCSPFKFDYQCLFLQLPLWLYYVLALWKLVPYSMMRLKSMRYVLVVNLIMVNS